MAFWRFTQLPPLVSTDPVRGGAVKIPESGVTENFDRAPRFPLIPTSGLERPDEEDWEAFQVWRTDFSYLTRTSGIVRGEGRNGSAGLVLKAIRTSPSGYIVPLEVEPDADYAGRCWLRTDAGAGGKAGVRVLEYDTPENDGVQPTRAFDERHLMRISDPVVQAGNQGGTDRAFRFRTSPRTRLVRLYFFLEGARGSRATFDDVVLERIRR
jgi:hypothetical protein